MSIRYRITLVTALFLTCVLIVLSILALSLQRALLTRENTRKVQVAVSMLAEMSASPLRSGDILSLATICDRAARGQPDRVIIADRYGRILADSEHRSYDDTNRTIQSAIGSEKEVIWRSGRFFEAAAPVADYSGRPIGAVYVSFSAQPLENQLRLVFRTVAGFAAVSILLGAILAYIMGKHLSSAFSPALAAMRRATAGDLGVQVPPIGVAELDEIGDTFNRMSFTIDRRVRDLERLNQMATELTRAMTAEEFANSVCTTMGTFSGAQCHVVLGDPATGALHIVGADIFPERASPNSAVALASRERRPITIGLRGDLSPGAEVTRGVTKDSAIVAPLIAPSGESVGALIVTYDWREVPTPRREDVASVSAIANFAAPALAAVRRGETHEEAMDALRDLLMPESPQEIEGVEVFTSYHPAETAIGFGGDYYDFLQMEGGRWGIAVGDVSGKGLEAGRYTSMVKYVIRSFALERRTAGDVMTRANVALTAQMGDVMFVTVFFAILDTARRRLTYSCAGHPAGLWLSHESGEMRELSVGGGALGIDGWSKFDESSVELQPHDLVVLYTDGIIEARRGDELYDTERLMDCIKRHSPQSLQEIAEAVMNDVREFAGNHIHDDLALVLIRVKEE